MQFVSLAFCLRITNRNNFQIKPVKDKKCRVKVYHCCRLHCLDFVFVQFCIFFTGILTEMLTVLRSSLRNASTMRVSSSQHSKTSGRNCQMNLSSPIYGICVDFVRNACD